MSYPDIGRVLFVDDKHEEVKNAISTLIAQGIPVQYWNGQKELPPSIQNVRIVILDLDLADIGERAVIGFYNAAIDALDKIPGPYIVIFMSVDFQDNDPTQFKKIFFDNKGYNVCGIVADVGLTKEEEKADSKHLQGIILKCIQKHRLFNFISLWEDIIDQAKDKAMSDIINNDVENSIFVLIQLMKRNYKDEGATREIISLLMRLILRGSTESIRISYLRDFISAVKLKPVKKYPTEDDQVIFSKIMYYKPSETEPIFTGDIFQYQLNRFALVLTPRCDILQNKTDKLLICRGFPLHEKYLSDDSYPIYIIDSSVKNQKEKGKSSEEIKAFIRDRYLDQNKDLTDNLHVLWNFRYDGSICGLCFNFNEVSSVDISKIKKWKLLYRLDSPYIDDLIGKYGSYVSRVGTMDINKCPKKLKESRDRLLN